MDIKDTGLNFSRSREERMRSVSIGSGSERGHSVNPTIGLSPVTQRQPLSDPTAKTTVNTVRQCTAAAVGRKSKCSEKAELMLMPLLTKKCTFFNKLFKMQSADRPTNKQHEFKRRKISDINVFNASVSKPYQACCLNMC